MKRIFFLYLLALITWVISPVQGQESMAVIPLALIMGAVSLATGAIKGGIAKAQHNKYAKSIDQLQKTMPQGFLDAEKIVNNMASNGLIGYRQMREEARTTLPTSINAYKDLVDNPTALLQATQTAESRVNGQLTELSIQDAIAKATSMENLADFQMQKGSIQSSIEDFNNQKKMTIAREKMMGNKELLGGIEQGISNGLNAYAGFSKLAAIKKNATAGAGYDTVDNRINYE